MLTDDDLTKTLEEIVALALKHFPLQDEVISLDPDLLITLSRVAKVAQRGLTRRRVTS